MSTIVGYDCSYIVVSGERAPFVIRCSLCQLPLSLGDCYVCLVCCRVICGKACSKHECVLSNDFPLWVSSEHYYHYISGSYALYHEGMRINPSKRIYTYCRPPPVTFGCLPPCFRSSKTVRVHLDELLVLQACRSGRAFIYRNHQLEYLDK